MKDDADRRLNNAYIKRDLFDSGYELGYFAALEAVIRVMERKEKENEISEVS